HASRAGEVAGPPTRVENIAPRPRVLLVHPGTQYSGYLADQLQRLGILHKYHTGFAFTDHGVTSRMIGALPQDWRKRLANRRLHRLRRDRLVTRPLLEIAALMALRSGNRDQEVF